MITTKKCGGCNKILPADTYTKCARERDGLDRLCRPCKKLAYESNKSWYQAWHLERTYGLTRKDFDGLLDSQGGTCAICERVPTSPHVDHDHATGKIRGILCAQCNHALGNMEDDIGRLLSAVRYLEMF